MDDVLLIDNHDRLRHWRSLVEQARLAGATPAVDIMLPWLDAHGNRLLTREAGRLRTACGCSLSGLCMTVAILIVGYGFVRQGLSFSDMSWSSLIGPIAFVVAAGVAGKLAALLRAHHRLLALVREIEAYPVNNACISTASMRRI